MLERRALQVKMVKTNEDGTETDKPPEDDYADKLMVTSEVMCDVGKQIFVFVAGYVALDTARKVIVAVASK